MGSDEDRRDLQSVIDFLATPLIVDVLRAVREGHPPRHSPELSVFGDAVDTAVEALAHAGVVAAQVDPKSPSREPMLILTAKGRVVSDLLDEVTDLNTPGLGRQQPAERLNFR